MDYNVRVPTGPLADAVAVIWHYDAYHPLHELERILPSGWVTIVINLKDYSLEVFDPEHKQWRTSKQAGIAGVKTRYNVLSTRRQECLMGVHFKPGGAYSVFGVPTDEFADMNLNLEDLMGYEGRQWGYYLAEMHSADERMRWLEKRMIERLQSRRALHPAIHYAVQVFHKNPGESSIQEVTDRTGLSSRRFIELFRRHVGTTPKLYCRIRRFQDVVQRLNTSVRIPDWCLFALESGYSDQSHFIRDFSRFSGLSPTAYFRVVQTMMREVPIEERGQICPIPIHADPVTYGDESAGDNSHRNDRQPCAA